MQIKKMRGEGEKSQFRDRPLAENKALFAEMLAGSPTVRFIHTISV